MTSKPKKVGLSVGELIVKAVAASKERNGLSVAALKKALAAGGYDVDKNKARVKTAIKSLVAKGTLVQTKGTRTSGSFKMNKATESKCQFSRHLLLNTEFIQCKKLTLQVAGQQFNFCGKKDPGLTNQ
uniref:Histone H1 n=1 Tax=Astatotilapia calliptera TaxID=8154 RepID=A0A3P8R1W7_ASTCA